MLKKMDKPYFSPSFVNEVICIKSVTFGPSQKPPFYKHYIAVDLLPGLDCVTCGIITVHNITGYLFPL